MTQRRVRLARLDDSIGQPEEEPVEFFFATTILGIGSYRLPWFGGSR
ncbi:hypothetical protein [uncultured Amnibacterium sp.]